MAIIRRRQPLAEEINPFQPKSKNKIRKLVRQSETGFFCMGTNSRKPFIAIPFPVQEIDKEGNLWVSIFKSDYKSTKDNFIRLLFQGNSFSDFLILEGGYTVFKDRGSNREKFSVNMEKENLLIKVIPNEAYCWDARQKKVALLSKKFFAGEEDAHGKKVRVG